MNDWVMHRPLVRARHKLRNYEPSKPVCLRSIDERRQNVYLHGLCQNLYREQLWEVSLGQS